MAFQYDKVDEGNNWTADSAVSIGIYNTNVGTSGQDKRSYGDDLIYTAARWNGGSSTIRDNGQWLRYTCSFEKGNYKLKIRGRNSSKPINLSLLDRTSLSQVFNTSLDYPNDFDNLGAGGDNSNVTFWFEKDINMALEAGEYIVEFSVPSVSSGGVFGEFSFEKNGNTALQETKHEPQSILISRIVKDGNIRLDLSRLNPSAWVRVLSMQGNIMQELMVAGEEIATIELNPKLPKGMYIIYVDDSESQYSEQFLLM